MSRRVAPIQVALALLLVAGVAEARTGGSGGADCFFTFVGLAALLMVGTQQRDGRTRQSGPPRQGWKSSWLTLDPEEKRHTLAHSLGTPLPLAELRRLDPYFSVPLFLDFLVLLYVRVQLQRGRQRLDLLAPYVSKHVLDALSGQASAELTEVSSVLVATAGIVSIDFGPRTRLVVNFLAGYVETVGGTQASYEVQERWTLARDCKARSKPPGRIAVLGCPGCGSAEDPRADGSCASCGRIVRDGRFDWFVNEMQTIKKVPARPPDLSTGIEAGAQLPTVFSHTLQDDFRAFRARHPDFDYDRFKTFVARSFHALKEAWTNRTWERARQIEMDHLFSMHRFWIEQYRAAGMENHVEGIKVEGIVGVKFERDAYYEGITVRIRATGLDYTLDNQGQVVAGSRDERRPLSEYWTFIRRIGHHAKAGVAEGCCPNCGAPLRISMAGDCEYCKARVTSGDFGWVVSSIESAARYGG